MYSNAACPKTSMLSVVISEYSDPALEDISCSNGVCSYQVKYLTLGKAILSHLTRGGHRQRHRI